MARYDLLLFGATGFTGNRVAREVILSSFSGKWAIAGRDRAKLEGLASSLLDGSAGGVPAPGIVVADVSDQDSLLSMARVLINTVGPFRRWGEPVVRACLEAGTHYLDVCGEPEFMERVELRYDDAARQAGVYLASAVAFDCVPGDLGAEFALAQFAPPARCTLLETALTIRSGPSGYCVHFPTYESAVHGFAHAGDLKRLRKEAEQKRGKVDLGVPGPKPRGSGAGAWEPRFNAFTFPFMGADPSVIRRSMVARVRAGDPAAHVRVVFTVPTRYYTALWQGFGAAFQFLAGRPWGRSLLLRYPSLFSYGLFSREGPTEQQLAEASFAFTTIASGYSKGAPESSDQQPDVRVVTRVSGPEPAYVACAIFVVQAAITLLEEPERLPQPGVHTPAALLRRTSYIDRLRGRGVAFERVESAAVQ